MKKKTGIFLIAIAAFVIQIIKAAARNAHSSGALESPLAVIVSGILAAALAAAVVSGLVWLYSRFRNREN